MLAVPSLLFATAIDIHNCLFLVTQLALSPILAAQGYFEKLVLPQVQNAYCRREFKENMFLCFSSLAYIFRKFTEPHQQKCFDFFLV